jgi:cysteine-rich secretory family protein
MTFKRPAAILLTAALSIGTLSALAAPAHAGSEESQFISKHNATRSSRGISTMSVRSDLTSVARRHSARMAAKGTIWHNPNLANEVSGNWTMLGENVGMGPDVNDLYQAFMDSAPHRHNILERAYNQFGVGVVIADGTIYVTIVFAARKSAGSVTYTRPKHKAAPRSSAGTKRRSVAHPVAAKPAAPKPAPAVAPRSVALLVQLVGMDAVPVRPNDGKALGLTDFAEQLELLST